VLVLGCGKGFGLVYVLSLALGFGNGGESLPLLMLWWGVGLLKKLVDLTNGYVNVL